MKHSNDNSWEERLKRSRQEKAPYVDVRYQVRQSIVDLQNNDISTTSWIDEILNLCNVKTFKTGTMIFFTILTGLYFYSLGDDSNQSTAITDPIVSYITEEDWSTL